jgi:glycosyltransferase involved in cell wall biosynthesis
MQNNLYNIAIVLPVYNGAKTVSQSIESVIAQTYTSWQLFVIDDGSTDTTTEIIKKYCLTDIRIIYLKNETNLGINKSNVSNAKPITAKVKLLL